jgi:drug/metabolite transporter (DMT)-like permease
LTKNNYKAHLALLGANIIYGVNHIVAKGVMPAKIGAEAFVFLRVLFAGLLFWFIKLFVKEKIEKKDIVRLMLSGLFGISINMLLFFKGLSLTSPIDASIIMTATPVIVLVLSIFIRNEKITTNKLLGISFGAIGAFVLIWYGNKTTGTSSTLGNLFVFLNACSYSLYLVMVKPLMIKYKPFTVISWVFLFGFIFMFPFGINDVIHTNFSAFTLHTYLTVAFVIIGTTFLTYLFNIYALTKVSPSVSGSYIYLQPVVSFIMVSIYAFLFNQNKYAHDINYVKILSSVLVVIGVYLISRKTPIFKR